MRIAAVTAAAAAAFAIAYVAQGDGGGPAPARADQAQGAALFAQMGCGSCHAFGPADAQGFVAPGLEGLLEGHTRESLVAVISAPPDPMPQDFERRMTARELDALADWLLATR